MLLVFAAAAALAAYAREGQSASPPTTLPVFAQPAAQLSTDAQVVISDTIGDFSPRFGITSSSFSDVRTIPVGSETMYVVPGSSGVCLVFRNASACGMPDDRHLIALFVSDGNGVLAGGGITDGAPHGVVISAANGSSASVAVRHGAFVLGPGASIPAELHKPVHIDAN
jgi:hypothetical protein